MATYPDDKAGGFYAIFRLNGLPIICDSTTRSGAMNGLLNMIADKVTGK